MKPLLYPWAALAYVIFLLALMACNEPPKPENKPENPMMYGPMGTPIVSVDVIINRNLNAPPTQTGATYINLCGCSWGTAQTPTSTGSEYVRTLTLDEHANNGEERYLVTVTDTSSNTSSTYILSMPTPTGLVRYSTSQNFTGCSLADPGTFSIDGKILTHTTSAVYFSMVVQNQMDEEDEFVSRRLMFFCSAGYVIAVQKAGSCPVVTI